MSSAASRLRDSLAAPAFTADAASNSLTTPAFTADGAHFVIAEKLRVVCDTVIELCERSGPNLDAVWSRRFAALDEQLNDCADYVAVLSASGRPPVSAPEFRALDVLADQLITSLNGVAVDLLLIERQSTRTAPTGASKLSDVAADYAEDARRERRASLTYFVIATALVLAAFGIVIAGLVQTASVNHPSRVWSVFSVYLMAALVSLVAAGVIIVLGERHRRAAQESTRLSRQFDVVESYLAPMATQARDLIRASLTPRLFSRILSDDDPMREPIWPTAADITNARPIRRAAGSRHAAPKRRPPE
jgi:hypothetical protein